MQHQIPDQLIDALTRRECTFFIGAGMSKEAGLPSSSDLARKASQLLKKENPSQCMDLQLIASEFIEKRGRSELEKVIREEIDFKTKNCNLETYHILSQLKPLPSDIITTNFDRLLEDTLVCADYEPIFDNKAVSKISSSKTNLFKLHGDIRRSELILTEDDIRKYWELNPELWTQIKSILQSKTTVFIGYSFNDTHIHEICKDISRRMSDSMPRVYIVDPNKKLQETTNLYSFKFLEMTARDFFYQLRDALNKDNSKFNSTFPYKVDDRSRNNKNPFSFYSTEFFPSKEDLINTTFIEPIDFSSIIEPGNTIIEGHRGSGKSMILKFLSYEQQSKRGFSTEWDKENIGIYVKLKPSLFKSMTKNRFNMSFEEWENYFRAYINLIIGESIIEVVEDYDDNGRLNDDSITNFMCEIQSLYPYLFMNTNQNSINSIRRLIIGLRHVRNSLTHNLSKINLNINLPPDFLYQIKDSLQSNIDLFKDKNIYILLDEYDNLDSEQQLIINTLIKDRDFNYKIGVKLLKMTYEALGGDVLEENHDYIYVSTDRFDYSDSFVRYIKFVKEIADKRLKAYGYANTIEEILPGRIKTNLQVEDEFELSFAYQDYSGFENIAKLSSGITRDFLELCKDMVYMSNKWIMNSNEMKKSLDPIPPNVQNQIIKIHSNILYNEINNVSDINESTGEPRKKYVRILIDKWAVIFQIILEKSHSKEQRTVSGFQLKNLEWLNATSREALDDAVAHRLLQIPLNQRTGTQGHGYVLGESFKFPRLLCPRFGLSLSQRWPREINSKDFNQLFVDPNGFIRKVTRKFEHDYKGTDFSGDFNQKTFSEF
jgi:hypothetical protein